MENTVSLKKRIIVLVVVTFLLVGITFSSWAIVGLENIWLKRWLSVLLNLSLGAVAFVAIKITKVEIGFNPKNWWQYLFGVALALTLSLFIAFIPAFCGSSIVGQHEDFDAVKLAWNAFNFFLIIGPVEELIFRVYYQETFVGFFKKCKWIGVIIAAFLFGWWHLINGTLLQVAFTFGIGLCFGMLKYFVKKCQYLGLALGHGLYDFLNVIVRMFVI